jgi:tetratricopeptide (TPR) repeat protein
VAIGLIGAALMIVITACGTSRPDDFVERLLSDQPPRYEGRLVSEEALALVEEVAAEYRREIDRTVQDTAEIGQLYEEIARGYLEIDLLRQTVAERLARAADRRPAEPAGVSGGDLARYRTALALRFMDSRIYLQAYENLRKAIEIFPENELLYANAGVCAGRMAKSLVDDRDTEERIAWFDRAEAHYGRAIELAPRYVDALYGLAVLYVYELDRASEAEPLVERILEIESRNTDALFVLAAANYRLGRIDQAIAAYRRIEDTSRVAVEQEAARQNRNVLEGGGR